MSPTDTFTYTVTYSYPCGDDIVNDITVNVTPAFMVTIIPLADTTTFAEGQEVELTALTDPALIGATYAWNTGQTGQTIMTTITQLPEESYSSLSVVDR